MLLEGAVVFVQHPLAYFTAKREVFAGSSRQVKMGGPQLEVAGLNEEDPILRFFETHICHVIFMRLDNDYCHRTLFDNRNGALQEVGEVQCIQNIKGNFSADRSNALQKSFKN